jgi:hypothetical protein
LLHGRRVKNPRVFRAVLCHLVLVAACGGAVEAPVIDDVGATKPAGCPSVGDVDTGAALGKTCAPEETYCADPACDPCTRTCPAVRCTGGIWTRADNTAHCRPSEDASPGVDAGTDAKQCLTIDPSTFDRSCAIDSDCVTIAPGTYCSGDPWCMCPTASINVDGQSRYQQELQNLQSTLTPGPRGCSCPFFGRPTCVAKQCVLCGGASNTPGCPDAG